MIYHSKKILVAAVMAAGFLLPTALVLSPTEVQASVIPKAPNNLGLVGYWSFNEGTGTVVNDYSGYGNEAIATTTTWVAGKFGKGLSFDGTASDVMGTGAGIPNVGSSANVTVSAWVYSTNNTGTRTVFAQGNSGVCYNYGLVIKNGVLDSRNTTNDRDISSTTIPLNTWTQVTIVFTPLGAQGYINGVVAGDINSTAGTTNCATTVWTIGARSPNSISQVFLGSIDEVRVYHRALSATEVAALYKAGGSRIGAPVSPGTLANGLVGWWPMDGRDLYQNVKDESGQGNNGYLTNFAATSTSLAIGKMGQALSFNGIGYIGGLAAFSQPSNITISAWFKTSSSGAIFGQSNTAPTAVPASFVPTLAVTTGGLLRGEIYTGTPAAVTSASTVIDNKWHHAVITNSGTTQTLYLDGVAQGSRTGTVGQTWWFTSQIGTGYDSNNRSICTGWCYFKGQIDDVRVYNRALSTAEVTQLYNLGAGTHANTSSARLDNGTTLASGLVGHWTFDGKDMYQNVADLSGQGNTGYLTGYTSTSSAVTIGRFGQGVHNFSATNYIDVPSSSSLNPGSTITVSAWFYPTGNSVYAPFVSKQDAPTATAGWEMAYNVTNGLLRTTLRGALVDAVGGTITLNKWQLGTFTYDGTTLRLYLNGVQVATASGSATLNSTGDLLIGKRLTNNNYFFGTVDDVRVYNRVLSATEITQLYNLGK